MSTTAIETGTVNETREPAAAVGPVTTTAVRSVPTRRISFEASLQDLPRHFTSDGDLITSHLVAVLSASFPDGEDFFVRSVRHYRDQITDPELKRQVAGFIGQESVHGREHRALNDRLDELGYPSKRMERMVRRILTAREKALSPEANLALTAALEHFTATLAELSLSNEEFRTMSGDTAVTELFTWHALEEAEHKAVAFDVYRSIGGSERTRIVTMKFARFAFVIGTAIQVVASLVRDRATYQPGRLRRSWRRFKRSPLVQREIWEQLKEYERPGFHPDDRDTDELVATWRDELFGDEGTLNDKLAGTAAAVAA